MAARGAAFAADLGAAQGTAFEHGDAVAFEAGARDIHTYNPWTAETLKGAAADRADFEWITKLHK